MSTVPDPQVVREIAREATQRAARRRDCIGSVLSEHAIMDEILASGDRSAYGRWCDAIKAEMQTAAVTVSWPEEQAQGERDAAAVDHWDPELWWPFSGGADTCYGDHGSVGDYRECCLRAGLAYALEVHEQRVRASVAAERDADARTVARLLRELRTDYPGVAALKAVTRVEERFADPIAALAELDARGQEGGAS